MRTMIFFLFVTCLAPTFAQERTDRVSIVRRPPCVRCWLPLQTQNLNVTVQLDGRTAVTEVTQDLFNPGGRLEEGSWLFPLPAGSVVERFTLFIDGVETDAELLDAEKAKRIYTDIVRSMRDPALLEYMGGGLFKARIFPIEARGTRTVRLRYRETLPSQDGLYRYIYPLRAAKFVSGAIGTFHLNATLDTETPLQTVYAPSHDFEVRRPSPRQARLSFEAQNHQPDRDVTLLYSMGNAPIGMDLSAHATGKDRFFWMTVTPDLSKAKIVPKDLVLLLDTSGSMAGEKMNQALAALRFCIANLNKQDRFDIIRFSTEAESLAGELLPASQTNREKASDFIDSFRPIGGTNLDEALQLALDLPVDPKRPQVVILVTDGKPTIGERNEGPLVKRLQQDGKRRVFVFGIGHEVNTHLLDKMAEVSGGQRTYAAPKEELELKLSHFYNRVQAPVMSRPRLRFEGVRVSAVHPGILPDLFRGTPLTIFGRYSGDGMAKVTLEGMVQGKKERITRTIRFPKRAPDHAFIPQLWAQRRVGHLLDEIRLHGEDRELVEEVKRLAKTYGIVTPYTSYLILEDNAKAADAPQRGSRWERFLSAGERQDEADAAAEGMSQKSGRRAVKTSEDLREMAASEVMKDRPAPATKAKRQQQWVAGRAFYLDGETWMDGSLPEDVPTSDIRFASNAYYDLLKRFPELAPILALGTKVTFIHNGQAYKIQD